MELSESKGIKVARWLPNMQFFDEDANYLSQIEYQTFNDFSAMMVSQGIVDGSTPDTVISGLRLIHSSLLTANLGMGLAISFSGGYTESGTSFGFNADPGKSFIVIVPVSNAVVFSAGGSQDRIDIVQARPIEIDYDQQVRKFKDPITGVKTDQSAYVKKEYGVEVAIVEGAESGSPSAPARTAGWIKLAEVYVAASASSITQSNIKDVRDSDTWTAETSDTTMRYSAIVEELLGSDTKKEARNSINAGYSRALIGSTLRNWSDDITIPVIIAALAYSPSLDIYVSVGSSNAGYSSDGVNWTAAASVPASGNWTSVVWSPELAIFCAVGSGVTGSQIMTSVDGDTWTGRTEPILRSWTALVWAPEISLFCAVASTSDTQQVMTSPDGVTWTARTNNHDRSWRGIAWSPVLKLFAASGYGAAFQATNFMTSPDGVTWTPRALTTSGSTFDDESSANIFWMPRRNEFVMVFAAFGSAVHGGLITSKDGTTWDLWDRREPLYDLYKLAGELDIDNYVGDIPILDKSVVWVPELDLFVTTKAISQGTGESTVAISEDGIEWVRLGKRNRGSTFGDILYDRIFYIHTKGIFIKCISGDTKMQYTIG